MMPAMPEQAHYKKGSKIWWDLTATKIPRPVWIPKGRIEQAGEVSDVEVDQERAVISIMNEQRKEEFYIVPFKHLRPRQMPD